MYWFSLIVKRFLFTPLVTLKHLVHGVVVITTNLWVGDPTIALGGFNARVTQQILYGHQVGIGVEHLRGHRVA